MTAIVVSYRTGPVLRDCLAALRANPEVAEIVVVDNGNPPEETALLDALQREGAVTLLRGHGNVGFGAGCNLGARASAAPVLMFVNPDLVLEEAAPTHLLETLRAAPRAPAIVGGLIFGPDGAEQRGARRDLLTAWNAPAAMLGSPLFERLGPKFRDPDRRREPLPAGPAPAGAVSGALFALTRADFDGLGGFDEGYFIHFEDFDICRRVYDAGGIVLIEPRARGMHVGGSSETPRAHVDRHKTRSMIRYLRKFAASPGEKALVQLYVAIIPMMFALRAAWRGRSAAAQRA